jgi:hypothetical protein
MQGACSYPGFEGVLGGVQNLNACRRVSEVVSHVVLVQRGCLHAALPRAVRTAGAQQGRSRAQQGRAAAA